jgi:5'-nucleotidase/UDP-sugar diphosphatase
MYGLAINNFQASGGDGYPKLTSHPSFVNTGFVDADILNRFIAANSPLKVAKFDPTGAVLRR